MPKTVGVLALQGDFEAHAKAVRRAGAEAVEVRTPDQLAGLDGLIIPGGESTTMLKLLNETGLKRPISEFAAHKPVFGTCAGAILLAREVRNPVQEALGVMDIAVERNAYGRQLDSRIVHLRSENGRLGDDELEAVFIRAPIIRRVGPDARVLLSYNGDPVLVEQGKHMVATFHPELSEDDRVHRAFVDKL
jgi:pyridoxal 5'-phosphate synthase pdxT subunit